MRIALGTAQLAGHYGIANRSGGISTAELDAMLDYAWANGMDTLDTAVTYGDSERRLGEVGVEMWRVVSKLPTVPDNCRDVRAWVSETARGCLNRLRLRKLHGLLLHRPQQLLEPGGELLYRALQDLKHDGVTAGIGVSIYDTAELDALSCRYEFDLVQAPFNVIDRRLAESGSLTRLARSGVEIHVRSVFLQGLLLLGEEERPARFARWDSLWASWEQWLRESGMTPLQACLRFVLSFPEISRAIVGVDCLEHLQGIVAAMEGPMRQPPGDVRSSEADLINPSYWAVQ